MLQRPYEDRRARLAELDLADRHWMVTDHQLGRGAEILQASREQGFEGVVGKRLGSRYRPGVRSPDWVKLKNYQHETFLIGGWLPDAAGHLEALLVGVPRSDGLFFAGTVEFGMNGQRKRLRELLDVIASSQPTFAGGFSSRRARFVEPRLTAKVRFIGRDAGVLREAILENVTLA
jgi:bifunctional non-homologous end joining protein LigD